MIAGFFRSIGPWSWVVVGVTLVLAEMMLPGVFLVWLGLAAVAIGVIDLAFDLSWQFASLVFGVLAVGFVFAGRYVSLRGLPPDDGVGLLNHRAHQLIGQVCVLDTPITRGEGRVRIGVPPGGSWGRILRQGPA